MKRVKSGSSIPLSLFGASFSTSDSFPDLVNLAPKGRTQVDSERIHKYNNSKASRLKHKHRSSKRKSSFTFERDMVDSDTDFKNNAHLLSLKNAFVNRGKDLKGLKNVEWSFKKEKQLRGTRIKAISGNPLLAKFSGKNKNEKAEHNSLSSVQSTRNEKVDLHFFEPKCMSNNSNRVHLPEENIAMVKIRATQKSDGNSATSPCSLVKSYSNESLELEKMFDLYLERISFVKKLVYEMQSQFECSERNPNCYHQSPISTHGADSPKDCIDQGLQTTIITNHHATRRAWWVEDFSIIDQDEQ